MFDAFLLSQHFFLCTYLTTTDAANALNPHKKATACLEEAAVALHLRRTGQLLPCVATQRCLHGCDSNNMNIDVPPQCKYVFSTTHSSDTRNLQSFAFRIAFQARYPILPQRTPTPSCPFSSCQKSSSSVSCSVSSPLRVLNLDFDPIMQSSGTRWPHVCVCLVKSTD